MKAETPAAEPGARKAPVLDAKARERTRAWLRSLGIDTPDPFRVPTMPTRTPTRTPTRPTTSTPTSPTKNRAPFPSFGFGLPQKR